MLKDQLMEILKGYERAGFDTTQSLSLAMRDQTEFRTVLDQLHLNGSLSVIRDLIANMA